jgi:hypothetical protein
MKAVKKIAIGAVGMAALLGASAPAAAQYYPGSGYGNVIGQVIQSVINPYGSQYGQYGQYGGQYGYGMNQQRAVQQCTAAVQQRLAGYSNYGGYGGYAGYGGAYGYTNAYSQGRVLGVTRVDQRSNTTLRVRGYATSGMNYGGYGGYGTYGGYNNAQADLTFKCDVDYRGYVRDIDIDRRY